MLSASSEKEKAYGIVRVFDHGNNGILGIKEASYILRKLMGLVHEYSGEFLKKHEELSNQIKEMEREIRAEKRVFFLRK